MREGREGGRSCGGAGKDWRWAPSDQGPRAGERGEGPEGGGLEDVFFCRNVLSSRVAWLHGCTERSRCCSLEPGKAEKIFLFGAGGQPAQGVVVASCRTKAGAGLPWPMGDAARPERRDGGPGLHGTRGRSRERKIRRRQVHGP